MFYELFVKKVLAWGIYWGYAPGRIVDKISERGEMADAGVFQTSTSLKVCGFNSHRSHHPFTLTHGSFTNTARTK